MTFSRGVLFLSESILDRDGTEATDDPERLSGLPALSASRKLPQEVSRGGIVWWVAAYLPELVVSETINRLFSLLCLFPHLWMGMKIIRSSKARRTHKCLERCLAHGCRLVLVKDF